MTAGCEPRSDRLLRLPLVGELGSQLSVAVRAARQLRGGSTIVWDDFGSAPVDLFVTLLELGYRTWLERSTDGVRLYLDPDGSVPRDGGRDKTGSSTHSVAGTPDGRVLATTTADRVVVLDASSRTVLGYVGVGSRPEHVDVSGDGRWLFAANSASDDVTVVDLLTTEAAATAPVGRGPLLPSVAPRGDLAWVPSRADGRVHVVRPDGSTAARIEVGASPHDIALSPDGRWAYQPNQGDGTVTVIDARALRAEGRVEVGTAPCHVAFGPDGALAYVANTASDDVSVVRTDDHEVIRTLRAGRGPHLPVATPDGRAVVVADFVSDDIVVWDATTYECRGVVPVGRYPHGLGLSPDARTLVVSHTGAASVAIVDISGPRVVASVDVEGAPGHVAFDPEGRCAFVACERAETVSVIDVTRGVLVGVVAVGGASDPARAEEQAAPVR